MTALLAVALGNTTAAIALAIDDRLTLVRRTPIDRLDGLRDVLVRGCPDCGGEATAIAVASVNPAATEQFAALVDSMTLPRPYAARVDFPIPLATALEEPERAGADRLLGALAAHRLTGGACITVDCGTAITVNAVAADGVFVGGAIFPGARLMARALARGTAALPEVPLPDAAEAVGNSPERAIAAGLVHGMAGAVTALIAGARLKVGAAAPVILTGGGAARLAPHLPADCRAVRENLVLEGLVIAYRAWAKP